MIILDGDTEKLQAVMAGAPATTQPDFLASYAQLATTDLEKYDGNHGALNGTTDVDLIAGIANKQIIVKSVDVFNRDTAQVVVTFKKDISTTDRFQFRAVLDPDESAHYVDGRGWFITDANGAEKPAGTKFNQLKMVTADVVNATTSFASITALSWAVKAGRKYQLIGCLFFITDATTTGARFGYTGPAMTSARMGQVAAGTPGIAASNIAVGVATANDTAMAASTTGPGATESMACIGGNFEPSADGTLQLRFASEVAVANALTIRRGSFAVLREAD